jgi:hypothetical protein
MRLAPIVFQELRDVRLPLDDHHEVRHRHRGGAFDGDLAVWVEREANALASSSATNDRLRRRGRIKFVIDGPWSVWSVFGLFQSLTAASAKARNSSSS